MNTKQLFANTINTVGSHTNLSANECDRFGITWGCRVDCPVFERGQCKTEDVKAFKKMIIAEDLSKDELESIYELYPKLKEEETK